MEMNCLGCGATSQWHEDVPSSLREKLCQACFLAAYWYASRGYLLYLEVVRNGEPTETYLEVQPPMPLTSGQKARIIPAQEDEASPCEIGEG